MTLPIIQVGDVLLSPDILTEYFCCDYAKCKGICCIEGDAGAPVTLDEIGEIEGCLDSVWEDLSATAQAMIDKQGVAYTDQEGDLVTSIVGGKDCVFTCYDGDNCLCALEKACRNGKTSFLKPISCSLYPIRVTKLTGGGLALNVHHWDICETAREKGRREGIRVFQFLRKPLTDAYGADFWEALSAAATHLLG